MVRAGKQHVQLVQAYGKFTVDRFSVVKNVFHEKIWMFYLAADGGLAILYMAIPVNGVAEIAGSIPEWRLIRWSMAERWAALVAS